MTILKPTKKVKFINCMALILMAVANPSSGQNAALNTQDIAITETGDYIVLGAFAIPNNAIRFSDYVTRKGMDAHVGYDIESNLYFVYINGTENLEINKSKVYELRETDDFYDAWLYRKRAGGNYNRVQQNEILRDQHTKEATTEAGQPSALYANEGDEPKQELYNEGEVVTELRTAEETTDEELHIAEVDPNEITRWDTDVYNEYTLFIDVRDENSGKPIDGIVEAIDPNVHRLLHNLKSNKVQFLGVNKRTSQSVRFETDVFGYRRKMVDIDLSNPVSDSTADYVEIKGDTIKLSFQLEPHRKGDIFTMYKVFFYPDAAIMKPTSNYELDKLLAMLKSNENYHIRLIGHTNGNGLGKIISLKEDDNNYFSITDNNIETFGSAKKLSEERANVMKRWLISQGIAEDRMEVQGMGGKMMIYEQDDAVRAKKNVRVEIEILKD